MSDESYEDSLRRDAKKVWEEFKSKPTGPISEGCQSLFELLDRLSAMPDFEEDTLAQEFGLKFEHHKPPYEQDCTGAFVEGPFQSLELRVNRNTGKGVFVLLHVRPGAAPILAVEVHQKYRPKGVLQVLHPEIRDKDGRLVPSPQAFSVSYTYEPLENRELVMSFGYDSDRLKSLRLGPVVKQG